MMATTMTDTMRRRFAAYWYAVGHADATGDTDLAEEFSRFALAQAEEYYGGKTSMMASIPEQWKQFMETRS